VFSPRAYRIFVTLLIPVLLGQTAAEQRQSYDVWGQDDFQIGSRVPRSDTLYRGEETLTIERTRTGATYEARADYERTAGGAVERKDATFLSFISQDGVQRDERNADPEFLTILNQPFAVRLDAHTIRDIRKLSAPSAFAFESSKTGAYLRGTLRRIPDGTIAGKHVVGIGFDASGPLHGAVPEHPEIALAGTMHMSGHAYYTAADALLMELDTTLEIAGKLADESTSDPVKIVYRRTIRAQTAKER